MCEWGNLREITIKRKLGLTKVVKVDACIADLIMKLNETGLYTSNSCFGHGKSGASIIFNDIKLLNTGYTEVYNREVYETYWDSLTEEEKSHFHDNEDVAYRGDKCF